MFNNPKELQDRILALPENDFIDEHLFSAETPHFTKERVEFVAQTLSELYRIDIADHEIIVVGSAKLGFALHDKYRMGAKVADAFRPYSAESDIDISICSPTLFRLLWQELSSAYSHDARLPVDTGKLGDYLCYGWLRFDKYPDFPPEQLTRYNRFRTARSTIRRNRLSGHPKADFGVFYDVEHLRIYQIRSISRCRQRLEVM